MSIIERMATASPLQFVRFKGQACTTNRLTCSGRS